MPLLKASRRFYTLLFLTIILSVQLHAQDSVTGLNVNSVRFDKGGFYRVTGKDWVETNSAGQDFGGITEIKRDDSSVYLKKPGGDSLRINVPGKMIYYIPVQGPSFALYPITYSGYEVRVTGRTVNYVFFDKIKGGLLKTTGKEWIEVDSTGSIISEFTETQRDDSMVHLKKSNGSLLLVDAKNKTTYIKEGNEGFVELYPLSITGNEIFIIAASVKTVGLNTGGSMYKDNDTWIETDAGGKEVARYNITGIKGLSVYLQKTDGTEFEISIEHSKVNKIVGGQEKETIYTLTSGSNELPAKSTTKEIAKETPTAPVFNNLASYRITNRWDATNGKSLDVVNDGKKDKVEMAKSGPYTGQYWRLTPIPGYPGYYRLTNLFLDNDLSLDIINDGTNNKISFGKTGLLSGQAWKITPLPDGYYRLTTNFLGEGKSLDIVNDGKNTKLQLNATDNYYGQYWMITEIK
jgi:hypothetical protein